MISGVPQGSILDPVQFILFFNDVAYSTKGASIIKYADGAIIYVAGKEIKKPLFFSRAKFLS